MSRLPSLTAAQVIRALERAGFVFHHATGSHQSYKHPLRARPVPVPVHGSRNIKRGLLHKIIKQAGLSREEFLKLL